MNFGIDFGTTNTAISRMEGDAPIALRFGDAQQPSEYVPSVLAIAAKKAREEHGHAAKLRLGQNTFAVYQNFKMLLGEPAPTVKAHWGSHLKATPEDITRRFIAALLKQIAAEHHGTPRRVVVTVPEVWLVQNLQTKREHLIEAFKAHGIPLVEAKSEPIAAATYYLHCFRHKTGQAFAGHLLVCDCGGGTMDFCLVEVRPGSADCPQMTVLERAGNGMVNGQLGSAGVAFDQAVIERLFPGLRARDTGKYFRRVREFEQLKIAHTDSVAAALALYRANPAATEGDELFALDDGKISVEPEHLARVFDERIAPGIRQAIAALFERIDQHAIARDDPERFRVLLVGGFSRFYLVQEAVKQCFGTVLSSDRRFEELLTLADRALAIAKGAALLANDLAEIIETCPLTLGVWGYRQTNLSAAHRLSFPILSKSVPIQRYSEPTWCDQAFVVVNLAIDLPVYIELLPDKPMAIPISGQTLRSILPSGVGAGSTIHIGFSVDANQVFSIHVRDANQPRRQQRTTLGNVLAQLPGLIVV